MFARANNASLNMVKAAETVTIEAGLAALISGSWQEKVSMKLALRPHNLVEIRSGNKLADKVTIVTGLAALTSSAWQKKVSMKLALRPHNQVEISS